MQPTALIGGVGEASDFSAVLIEELLAANYHVAAISRTAKPELLKQFSQEKNISFFNGDMQDANFIKSTIDSIEQSGSTIEVYIHNAALLVLKPFFKLLKMTLKLAGKLQ